jgi:hypothetical protein
MPVYDEALYDEALYDEALYDEGGRGRPGRGRDWPEVFAEVLGAPVVLRSYGPTAADKRGPLTGANGIFGRRRGHRRAERHSWVSLTPPPPC